MSEQKKLVSISKFLSLVLRHKPETIGIQLDDSGWVEVSQLLECINASGKELDFETLELVVETNSKKRFAFNEDQSKIRASQGHSIDVTLGYKPQKPPVILYHGTATRFKESILKSGILRQKRQHVHLSSDIETAINVGQRHGKPVVLQIEAAKMVEEGFDFYISENGVWLTEEVPHKFIQELHSI